MTNKFYVKLVKFLHWCGAVILIDTYFCLICWLVNILYDLYYSINMRERESKRIVARKDVRCINDKCSYKTSVVNARENRATLFNKIVPRTFSNILKLINEAVFPFNTNAMYIHWSPFYRCINHSYKYIIMLTARKPRHLVKQIRRCIYLRLFNSYFFLYKVNRNLNAFLCTLQLT